MPRQRIRTTARGTTDMEVYRKAAEEHFKDGEKIRTLAKKYNVCHVTLYRLTSSNYGPRSNSPVPGPSGLQQTSSSHLFSFSPKDLRPLPQAGPRTSTNKGRKKRKTAILTDTSEKNSIEEEYRRRNKAKKTILQPDTGNGKRKLTFTKGKGKGKKTKKSLKDKENKSDEEDCFCLVCLEHFTNSRPNEQWIQCIECKMWSHIECVSDDVNYVCHNCVSDTEY